MKPRIKRGTLVSVWTTHDGTYRGKFLKADGWGNVELTDCDWVYEDRISSSRLEASYRYALIRGADAVRVY